jgi:LysM repeat protein
MNQSSRYRLAIRLGFGALALLLGLGVGLAQAEDKGPRHHAAGQYDAATSTYGVVAGDDIDAIAERFGVTLQELTTANKLSSTEIEVGQKLAIPGRPAGKTAPNESATAGIPGLGELTGPPADPQYKYSTAMPPDVATPDRVETRLGTLRFDGGIPDQATSDKLFDNLDFQRAVQAYLLALPPVNQLANRTAILAMGPANRTVPIWEQLVDSRTVELTANDNTVYSWF